MIDRCFCIIIYLIIPLTFVQSGYAQKPQHIGTLAGVAITKEEVQREMGRYRSVVYRELMNKGIDTIYGPFWSREIDGAKAIDVLKTEAVNSLYLIKVQEKLLIERNLWPYKAYEFFLKDLAVNNRSRKKSVKRNGIIGPVEFNEQTFFDYRFSNALIQLKQNLVNEKLIVITEEDLQKQFKKMQNTVYKDAKYTLSAFRKQVREAYVEEAYKILINKYVKKATVDIDSTKLNQIIMPE